MLLDRTQTLDHPVEMVYSEFNSDFEPLLHFSNVPKYEGILKHDEQAVLHAETLCLQWHTLKAQLHQSLSSEITDQRWTCLRYECYDIITFKWHVISDTMVHQVHTLHFTFSTLEEFTSVDIPEN